MFAANTPYLGHHPPYTLLEEASRLEQIQMGFLCDQEGQQREAISANHYRLLRLGVLIPEPRERIATQIPFDPFLNSIPIELPKVIPSKRSNPHLNPSSSANPPTPQDPKIKRVRTTEHARASEAVKLAVGLLEEEFNLREAASEAFLLDITSSHIRTSGTKYENEMSAASERSACCCCGKLIAAGDISALEDLTAAEECLIAKSHPVGTILKLRLGHHSSFVSYNALRGHMIVIPQDPGPLLQILPSPELSLDTLIKVFWLGKRAPVDADLRPFLQVRKDKVLAALQYLVGHNHLYRDLTINHAMMGGWNEDFIPSEIRDNIICLGDSDHHEREGYPAIRLAYRPATMRMISMPHKTEFSMWMTTDPA
ncbi:uncharacterized protein PAC_12010 [Phialocephala subalpina]|uniref:DUF6570 domain-containing protein n=1 Tax=Phialocephala subalpina TaxID=576137 RepID=A0A1L7XAQ2_9HELO|nr:uncharacterized protein PAC_12010 [Phialocephala subalpina]